MKICKGYGKYTNHRCDLTDQPQSLSNFGVNKSAKDGLKRTCKHCWIIANQAICNIPKYRKKYNDARYDNNSNLYKNYDQWFESYTNKPSVRTILRYRSRTSSFLSKYGITKDIINGSSLNLLGGTKDEANKYLQSKIDITYPKVFSDNVLFHIDHKVALGWIAKELNHNVKLITDVLPFACNMMNLHFIPAEANLTKGMKLLPQYEELAKLILLAGRTGMSVKRFMNKAAKLEAKQKEFYKKLNKK